MADDPTPPQEPMPIRDIGGPIRPADPAQWGTLNLLCPHCRTVLVEHTTASDVVRFEKIQCFLCGKWSSGLDLDREGR